MTAYLGHLAEDASVWVTLYEVQRCYGGPEEGGWYYDHMTPIRTRPCLNQEFLIERRIETIEIEEGGDEISESDALDGEPTYEILVEEDLHQFKTTARPRYE